MNVARAAGLAYREEGPADGPPALLVHGYPESSYMWHDALPALGEAGMRAIAPDLAGYGDSEPDPPGTWERHVESLQRLVDSLELSRVAVVTHDWGVLIGLRWACDHPASVTALVISDGGFFADRRWHDLANVMRTPGDGERLVQSYEREPFGQALRGLSPGRLDVPALILWGGQDQFAGVKMAQRFADELPGSELKVFEDAGHFVWDDEPQRTTEALVEFLSRHLVRTGS